MHVMSGQLALVTGATGAIGSAIAAALARRGANIRGIVRHADRLRALAAQWQTPIPPTALECDFADDASLAACCRQLSDPSSDADILVIASGQYVESRFSDLDADKFDHLYRVNLRAPYLLARAAVPGLMRRRGRIVVISSPAALRGRSGRAHYSAMHAALLSLVQTLRDEVNEAGVSVLVVYPGRTASEIWRSRARLSGEDYPEDLLLQPSEIATAVVSALELPRGAEVTDLHIRPLNKCY